MYVDNVISGANLENEAFAFYEQSKKIFHDASFNQWKLVTSSKSLQERSITTSNLLSDEKTAEELTSLMSPMDKTHLDALMDLKLESTSF